MFHRYEDGKQPTTKTTSNKFQKKQEKENFYQSIFAPYRPSINYNIQFVNASTSEEHLLKFKYTVESNRDFICDTESSIRVKEGALLQLLALKENMQSVDVYLVEMKFLPLATSSFSQILRQTFTELFNTKKRIIAWGSVQKELQLFKHYPIIPQSINIEEIDLQLIFKSWFTKCLAENPESITPFPSAIASNLLSAERMSRYKNFSTNAWSIQDAVMYIFQKYLSKKETCKRWCIGLDENLTNKNREYSSEYRRQLIKYAVFDCLSLLDLMMFMYNQYLSNQRQCQEIQSFSDYFATLQQQQQITPKIKKKALQVILDDSEEDMDGHELYDHHSSSLVASNVGRNSKGNESRTTSNIILVGDEFILTDERKENVMEYETTAAIILVNNGTKEENDRQPIIQEENDRQSINQDETSQESMSIQLLDQQEAPTKRKKKPKRSMEAKKKRNQKANEKHRQNRYEYKIIRPLNMTIKEAKAKLHAMNLMPVENIKPIGQTLIIAAKDQQQQEELNRRLPMDIFL